MAPYAPVPTSPDSPTATSRRSSLASRRRPSVSSFLFSQRAVQLPDPDEMDAAFDGPDDDERRETQGLLVNSDRVDGAMPGQYDFERDYVGCSLESPNQLTTPRPFRLHLRPHSNLTPPTTLRQATPTASSLHLPSTGPFRHGISSVVSSPPPSSLDRTRQRRGRE